MVRGRKLKADQLKRLQDRKKIDPGTATNNINNPTIEEIEGIQVDYNVGHETVS